MTRIAIFAEGYTDQLVIAQVLLGGLVGDEEPLIHFAQPLEADPGANGTYAPGGWTVLFAALRRGEHRLALQFNDVLVIHVDTDVCDEIGFDVPRAAEPDQLAAAVERRLCLEMGAEFCDEFGDRIVFAVAVDEVECWFLPLLFPDQAAKSSKTTGCFEAVERGLARRQSPSLHRDTGKNPEVYRKLAAELSKSKVLKKCALLSPSLGRFVARWQEWQLARTAGR